MQRRRGRPRRPRLSRMDAAVDAMSPMGFTERLVTKCVKQLLEEYGGNDGWPFIEADSYKELIEAILRHIKENEQDRVGEGGEQSNSKLIPESENMPEENEQPLETSDRAPETQTEDAPQQNPDKSEDNAPENVVDSSSAIAEPGCSKYSSTSLSMVNNADRTTTAARKGIVQCQSHVSASEPTDHVLNKNGEEPKARAETDNNAGYKSVSDPKKIDTDNQVRTSMIPRSVTISFTLPTINKQPIKRKSLPCFGWIEDDEEGRPNSAVHKTPGDPKKIEAKSSKSNNISSPSPIVDKQPVKANRSPCYGWIDNAKGACPSNDVHKIVPDPKKIEAKSSRSNNISSPSPIVDKQPVKTNRSPCYGWIDNDQGACPSNDVHKIVPDPKKIEAKISKSNNISSPSPIVDKQPVKTNHSPSYGWIGNDKGACPSNDVHKIVPDPKKIEAHRQTKSLKIPQGSNSSSPLPNVNKRQPIKRRRFPCHGWIDNEEDDAPIEFVYSKPAPGSFSAKPVPVYKGKETLLRSPFGERKRKPPRWDQSSTY